MKQINEILYNQFKSNFWRFLIIAFLILTAVGLEVISPLIYTLLIDNVLGGKPVETDVPILDNLLPAVASHFDSPPELAIFVVFLFFAINVMSNLVNYAHLFTTKVAIQKAIYEFSRQAYLNLESYNIGFFRKVEIGDYIYRLSYDVDSIGDLLEDIISIATSILLLILTTSFMFFVSAKLTLISLITTPFLAATLYIFNKRVDRATRQSEQANSVVFSFIQQALMQLKIIQAYSQEKFMSNEFNQTERDSLKAQMKLEKVNYLYDLVAGIAITIVYATIFSYGVSAVFAGELTAGFLIFLIYSIDNLTNPMINIADSIYSIKQSYIRVSRLSDFFDVKSHLQDSGTIQEVDSNALIFDNVTLIGEENFHILNNISCKIPANKITIVAGISGSGKTSFISLIPRLIEKPTAGQVLLGNKDITQYSVKSLRDSIAFVAQENSLFNHSIKNIIAFGKPNATYEEIQEAARLACAEEFILNHPQGYSFKVGEGGNYLSGGQRQRLMLARAFIKNSNILILDEPFSNLDEDTKKRLWKNIKEYSKDRTVIIVSNILDFISQADYIIIINSGLLKYEGEYKDLKNKNNLANLLLESF